KPCPTLQKPPLTSRKSLPGSFQSDANRLRQLLRPCRRGRSRSLRLCPTPASCREPFASTVPRWLCRAHPLSPNQQSAREGVCTATRKAGRKCSDSVCNTRTCHPCRAGTSKRDRGLSDSLPHQRGDRLALSRKGETFLL